jgi:hypothetical protein
MDLLVRPGEHGVAGDRNSRPRLIAGTIETRYTADLLGAASGGGAAGVGYLLKDRVADVGEFIEALTRVAAGGTALDSEVVTQLFGSATCSR